jgi:hypothetical protein
MESSSTTVLPGDCEAEEALRPSVPQASHCRLEIEPRLLEEATLLAVESLPRAEQARFRQQRDPLYELEDPRRREERFRTLHEGWFQRLKLAAPLEQVLAEHPSVFRSVTRFVVATASSPKEEYADLHRRRSPAAGEPVLILRLRPRTLLDRSRLIPLLRHELLHVADMLDPAFGYEPDFEPPVSPALSHLVRERYRVLWDTSVDGRLALRGALAEGGEEIRRREFDAVFSMLGDAADAWFDRFFKEERPTHSELVAFAMDLGQKESGVGRGSMSCSLCRLPTATLHPRPQSLDPAILAAIRCDFPAWSPVSSLCRQCADLYAARIC